MHIAKGNGDTDYECAKQFFETPGRPDQLRMKPSLLIMLLLRRRKNMKQQESCLMQKIH